MVPKGLGEGCPRRGGPHPPPPFPAPGGEGGGGGHTHPLGVSDLKLVKHIHIQLEPSSTLSWKWSVQIYPDTVLIIRVAPIRSQRVGWKCSCKM